MARSKHRRRLFAFMVPCLSAAMILGMTGPASAVAGPMKVTAAYFQVDGAPSPPTNIWLNKEYIVVRNMGTTSAVLTGWTLRDLARPGIPSHVYKFPTSFHLAGGAIVRVHTGAGTNTAADLYWHLTVFVWGDDSDTATLKNASAVTVSTCAWTAGSPSPKFC